MLHFWWGRRGNLKLITLWSESLKQVYVAFFQVKSAPLPVKRSTHLFESGSPLFRVVLFICVGLLACFVVAGLLVEWVRRMKNRTRIYNEGNSSRSFCVYRRVVYKIGGWGGEEGGGGGGGGTEYGFCLPDPESNQRPPSGTEYALRPFRFRRRGEYNLVQP